MENTITVVETEHGAKFGLFTSLPPDISGKWKPDPKAWVFSLTHQTVHRQYQNHKETIFFSPNTFPSVADFKLGTQCCLPGTCTSDFGRSFKPPQSIQPGSPQAH